MRRVGVEVPLGNGAQCKREDGIESIRSEVGKKGGSVKQPVGTVWLNVGEVGINVMPYLDRSWKAGLRRRRRPMFCGVWLAAF